MFYKRPNYGVKGPIMLWTGASPLPQSNMRNKPRHDKANKVRVRPAKTQISLGIRPVWSESSLSAWRNLGSLATHWEHSEDSDQTGRMPRLIWVFAGRTLMLLVLSCRGSNNVVKELHYSTDMGGKCLLCFQNVRLSHQHFLTQFNRSKWLKYSWLQDLRANLQ